MLEKAIVYVVDESPHFAVVVRAIQTRGLETLSAISVSELFSFLNRFSPECLVVLAGSPAEDSILRLAAAVRSADHHCSLLVVTTGISTEFAIQAMKAGVSDLLDWTASPIKMAEAIASLAARHRECHTCVELDNDLPECRSLVGSGDAMKRLRSQVARVAASDANVLITGESGTGKELVAQTIHQQSRRRARPFVAVNCAAVPDTLLESELFGFERGAFTGAHASHDGKLQHAAGGTLFLDEIGEMSLMAQAKILRAVDNRVIQRLGSNVDTRVQLRLVAATNQNLERLIQDNRFRRDLYYRLNVVRLTVPPLRERPEDIPELIGYMMAELTAQQRERKRIVEGEVVRRFQQYDWPGNVRELRNVLESILVFSSSRSIGSGDIPVEIGHKLRRSKPPFGDERSQIISALNSAHWNRNDAAKILCCSRMTLYRKMEKYGIPAAGAASDRAS